MSNTPRIDLVERNLIINGNFDFWQRGTTKNVGGGGLACLADRFKAGATAGFSTVTYSQSNDVPAQTLSGFESQYSMLLTNGTGATAGINDYIAAIYVMEGYDYQQIHNRTIRLQFWVKCSVTGIYTISLNNYSQATYRNYTTTYTVSSANTWQKVTIDVQMDSTSFWNFSNSGGLQIWFYLDSGSNAFTSTLNQWQSGAATADAVANTQTHWGATTAATFQLAQVMLIPQDYTRAGSGTVDVPFQRCGRSIGHELQLCQRYYEKSYDLDQVPGTITDGWVANGFQGFPGTGRAAFPICYRTTKRATPSLTFYNPSTGASGSISINVGTISSLVANFQRTGSVVADATNSNGVGTSIGANIHFTADAEL